MTTGNDPRRRATRKQRWMAYFLDKGKCAICGKTLHEGFDIDHKQPWSKKGPTQLWNLRATCPQCNRKRGAKSSN